MLSESLTPLHSTVPMRTPASIKSLYTVFPNNGGLQPLSHFFDQRANKEPPTHTLTRLAELVLTLNSFSFNGEHYRQIGGVAVGSKMGPKNACLYVGYIEEHIRARYTGFVPQLLRRYIDDVVGCAQCSRHVLEQYIDYVSNFHPALQFTSTISKLGLPLLDIKLKLTATSYRHRCTTRKLTRVTISITRHSILITVRG